MSRTMAQQDIDNFQQRLIRVMEKRNSDWLRIVYMLTENRAAILRNEADRSIAFLSDVNSDNSQTLESRIATEYQIQAYELLLSDLDYPHAIAEAHRKLKTLRS